MASIETACMHTLTLTDDELRVIAWALDYYTNPLKQPPSVFARDNAEPLHDAVQRALSTAA